MYSLLAYVIEGKSKVLNFLTEIIPVLYSTTDVDKVNVGHYFIETISKFIT